MRNEIDFYAVTYHKFHSFRLRHCLHKFLIYETMTYFVFNYDKYVARMNKYQDCFRNLSIPTKWR